MQTVRLLVVLLCVGALLGLAPLTASAATPVGLPAGVGYADNLPHVVAPQSSLWFRFEYKGDESPIVLSIPGMADNNIAFTVYHPSGIDIGVGSRTDVEDLLWSGGDGVRGTYYVKVVNNNAYAVTFRLIVEGSGVSYSPSISEPAKIAESDPARASLVDSGLLSVPVNSSRWYKYTFGGDSQATLTLVNGQAIGLSMSVYTSDQTAKWWSETPIGKGNVLGNDLVWTGSMPNGETIYIVITNENPFVANFTINVATLHLIE